MPRLRREIANHNSAVAGISVGTQTPEEQADEEFKKIFNEASKVLDAASGMIAELKNPNLSTDAIPETEIQFAINDKIREFKAHAFHLIHYIINTDKDTYLELSFDDSSRYVAVYYATNHKDIDWYTDEQRKVFNLGEKVVNKLIKTVAALEKIQNDLNSPKQKALFFGAMRKNNLNINIAKHKVIDTIEECFAKDGVYLKFCDKAEFPRWERAMSSSSVSTRSSISGPGY